MNIPISYLNFVGFKWGLYFLMSTLRSSQQKQEKEENWNGNKSSRKGKLKSRESSLKKKQAIRGQKSGGCEPNVCRQGRGQGHGNGRGQGQRQGCGLGQAGACLRGGLRGLPLALRLSLQKYFTVSYAKIHTTCAY